MANDETAGKTIDEVEKMGLIVSGKRPTWTEQYPPEQTTTVHSTPPVTAAKRQWGTIFWDSLPPIRIGSSMATPAPPGPVQAVIQAATPCG